MRTVGVIPARYNSSRLPGKPLMDICGKPMIWWVYQQVIREKRLDDVVVAADDERIIEKCTVMGMHALLTKKDHDTPTARLCEVSKKIKADLYLLVMGDEPLVNRKCFSLIIPEDTPKGNYFGGGVYVAALTNVLVNATEVIDFSNQKVLINTKGNAICISRSPIPYPKGTLDFQYEKVTGIQLFSKSALDFFENTPKSLIEQAEENDLMRFIENEIPVKMIYSPYKTVSVDTKTDLDMVRNIIAKKQLG